MITVVFKIKGDKTVHDTGEYCEKHIDIGNIQFFPSFNHYTDEQAQRIASQSYFKTGKNMDLSRIVEEEFKQKYDDRTITVRFSGISRVDGCNMYEFDWTREDRNDKIEKLL